MTEYITPDFKIRLKGLGLYQIIGGIIGLGIIIWVLVQAEAIKGSSIAVYLVAAVLFSYSIFCGQLLLKNNLKGLTHSMINQVLQTVNFAFAGFAFKYASGIMLMAGLDFSSGHELIFNFEISTFELNINSHKELSTAGLNIFAFYLLYFIETLKEKIERHKKTITLLARSSHEKILSNKQESNPNIES